MAEEKSLLDISAEEFWYKTLVPAINDFNTNYHSDINLNKTLKGIVNKGSSFIVREKYLDLQELFDPLFFVIESSNFGKVGDFKNAEKDEREALVELVNKINDLKLILEYEKPHEKEAPEIRERLNYEPPNGVVAGHNTDDLSNRLYYQKELKPKQRIPNVTADKKYNF